MGPGGVLRALDAEELRAASTPRAAIRGGRAACFCTASAIPAHEVVRPWRAPRRRRARLALARAGRGLPRVRAVRDHRGRRRAVPLLTAYLERPQDAPPRAACPSRRSCSPAAASPARIPPRPTRRAHRAQRPGGRRGGRRPAGRAVRRSRTCLTSTWAARPATSAWSRAARSRERRPRGRRPCARAADGRHPHGRRGRRLDRLARRRRRPARGPAVRGRRARARLLRPRRQRPTVTDANLVLGHLDPDAPLAGGVRLDAAAPPPRGRALARELGLDLEACAEGIVRVANAEMVRALRVMTVERGLDPRELALLGLRRGRADARRGDRRGARDDADPRAAASARRGARARSVWTRLTAGARRPARLSTLLRGDGLTREALDVRPMARPPMTSATAASPTS